MKFILKSKEFIKKLFHRNSEAKEDVLTPVEEDLSNITEESLIKQDEENFRINNVVFQKLDYLEQYIKITSITHPGNYDYYLDLIKKQRAEYEEELLTYKKGFEGIICFAVDPEIESKRHIMVSKLEAEIEDFVENCVYYNSFRVRFSNLCIKINTFYNVLINTKRDNLEISSKLASAIDSLRSLVNDVRTHYFFKTDSRKKEEILNFILYCEYLIFKSSLRCKQTSNFYKYKTEFSQFYSLFIEEEYDKLMFKYFIENLEMIQNFITDNLSNTSAYAIVLKTCQDLQNKIGNYNEVYDNDDFFSNLIKFENTVKSIATSLNIEFKIFDSHIVINEKKENSKTSVNTLASSIFSSINSDRAKLLYNVVKDFNYEISYREFYFLCKIFNISDEVLDYVSNTIYNSVVVNFKNLKEEYSGYSDEMIEKKKQKVLEHSSSKPKKYILFYSPTSSCDLDVSCILDSLSLDFVEKENKYYLNYIYFNGFKNLEKNFNIELKN